eukprot:gnl/TRDRNA2_/TRDRNA2_154990_c0_seq1.p1 gnl/TRDRNA2_/TRDRNA2_154990_c0~~gnl/TRDRNA2_/TRDRNA2_154990_c0_seq1.p1  ORF type:complete len:392 (-),score=53.19 gnl/TRDRNA2_/TRDRNA2_154990_c0_seq1:128-1303(-)
MAVGMRPSSGSSCRSRRDEVWEMKRQRWLAKQGGGGGKPVPPPIYTGQGPSAAPSQAPGSPLSRLVAGGYPMHDGGAKYSEPLPAAQDGGFGANIQQQWSSNCVRGVHQGQDRHDPEFSGPAKKVGGMHVAQAPGGVSSISLNWEQQQQQKPRSGGSGAPPRMPGAPSYAYQQEGAAGVSVQSYGSRGSPFAVDNGVDYTNAHQRARGGGPRAPSPTVSAGRAAVNAPFGTDGQVQSAGTPSGRSHQGRRQEQCPFGYDNGSALQQQQQQQFQRPNASQMLNRSLGPPRYSGTRGSRDRNPASGIQAGPGRGFVRYGTGPGASVCSQQDTTDSDYLLRDAYTGGKQGGRSNSLQSRPASKRHALGDADNGGGGGTIVANHDLLSRLFPAGK